MIGNEIRILNGRRVVPTAQILRGVYRQPGDLVVVSGSLIEGIGTTESDFDIYVICPRRFTYGSRPIGSHNWIADRDQREITEDRTEVFRVHDYLESHFHVDVCYFTFDEIDACCKEIETDYVASQSNAKMMRSLYPFPGSETADILHKLAFGKPLDNFEAYEAFSKPLPISKLCYLLFRKTTGGHPELKDVVGWLRDGDHFVAAQMIRTYVTHQLAGLLNLLGAVLLNLKWTYAYADRMLSNHIEVRERYFEMLQAATITTSQQRAVVDLALDLTQLIYEAIQKVLGTDPHYPPAVEMAARVRREFEARPLASGQLDLEIRHRLAVFEKLDRPLRDVVWEAVARPAGAQ